MCVCVCVCLKNSKINSELIIWAVSTYYEIYIYKYITNCK